MSSSSDNREAALPSSSTPTSTPIVSHSTPRRRPTVSFSEVRAQAVNSNVANVTNSAPSTPTKDAQNATEDTERATAVDGSLPSSSSHGSNASPNKTSSQLRKRGCSTSSGSPIAVPASPHQSPSSQSASTPSPWKGEVINSPFARKRALSKTSPYHAASLSMPSPVALQPLVPAMILSGTQPSDQGRQGDKATTEVGTESAPQAVKQEHSSPSLGQDMGQQCSSPAPLTPSAPVVLAPTLARMATGPGGRSLEVDTSPPTRMRKFTNFLSHLYDKYSPSLTLENKGSVARDHLANERTFLAWLRTSLSLITVGVAVTQLFRLQSSSQSSSPGTPSKSLQVSHVGRPLGGSFLCLGILFLWIGASRYFHGQTVMSYGKFPASRGSVILAAIAVLSVLIACLIIVLLDKH